MKKIKYMIFFAIFAMMTTMVFGQVNLNETFDTNPTLAASKTAGAWYTDRYAPAKFESALFDGDNRLHVEINQADFQSDGWYNYQGRKYDLGNGINTFLQIDLYIDSDWNVEDRHASIWGTTRDENNDISGYPIVGFTNSSTYQGFRVFVQDTDFDSNNGYTSGWYEIGLPSGFTFGNWYTIKLVITGDDYKYYINDQLVLSDPITFNSVLVDNLILQGYNYGDTYDIYWDNLITGSLNEIWVDDDWTNQADVDAFDNTLIWQVNAFDVIQDGVDEVGSGFTVNVLDGTYYENVVIEKGLHLKGMNSPILDGQNLGDRVIYVDNADDVTISGFVIQNSGVNTAADVGGILLYYSNNAIIRDNLIRNNDHGLIIAYDSGNNLIQHNKVIDNNIHCIFSGQFTGNLGNKLEFNYFDGAGDHGVFQKPLNPNVLDARNNWWGDCSGPGGVGPGSGLPVSSNVIYDPWIGKGGGNDAALWLSPATLAGSTSSNIPLWEGLACGSLDATMIDQNRQPKYNSVVEFKPDPYWIKSDAMEVVSDQDVTTSVTQVNGNGQVSKSIYVAFTPEAPANGTQFIFEIGGQKSGVSIAIQQGFLVAGMWNPWERLFWTSSSQLVADETNLIQVQFVRDETVSPVVSKFRVILNGNPSNWVNFRGIIWDDSPSGIGAGVKGTALRNVYYSHNHINHFDGLIREIIVINNQTETESADMYNDLMSSYSLTGPTVTPKEAWNLEVWEDINLDEDGFELFPNPAQYSASLKVNLIENSNVNVSLVQANGKVVSIPFNGMMNQGVNIIDIDTDQLPPGVYNAVIEIGGRTKTERLVIIK